MSPKSRRGKAKFRRITGQSAVSSTTRSTPTTPSTPDTKPVTTVVTTSQPEYIINDLKLIGIIAGSMVVCIIILSFIL